MKKIFTILSIVALGVSANAQTEVVNETFSYTGALKDNGWVSHSGTAGQLVKSATISAQSANVDVASLPKGNYVVTAELNGEKVSQKVIKK